MTMFANRLQCLSCGFSACLTRSLLTVDLLSVSAKARRGMYCEAAPGTEPHARAAGESGKLSVRATTAVGPLALLLTAARLALLQPRATLQPENMAGAGMAGADMGECDEAEMALLEPAGSVLVDGCAAVAAMCRLLESLR